MSRDGAMHMISSVSGREAKIPTDGLFGARDFRRSNVIKRGNIKKRSEQLKGKVCIFRVNSVDAKSLQTVFA